MRALTAQLSSNCGPRIETGPSSRRRNHAEGERRAGELLNEGTTVSAGDLIIGTTAQVVDEPVLTRNVDEFERLGVDVETY